jgi:hypothetical protein
LSASALSPEPQAGWWTKPALLIAVILLAGAPLWWPGIPPLTDLPGHMGRYAVQLDGGNSADLARWYHFEWRWIGNLGVDLLVQILGPTLGVEAATKLVAIAIPMLTVAGFLAVAREVHGRVPPTAFFCSALGLWGALFLGLCELYFVDGAGLSGFCLVATPGASGAYPAALLDVHSALAAAVDSAYLWLGSLLCAGRQCRDCPANSNAAALVRHGWPHGFDLSVPCTAFGLDGGAIW